MSSASISINNTCEIIVKYNVLYIKTNMNSSSVSFRYSHKNSSLRKKAIKRKTRSELFRIRIPSLFSPHTCQYL